MLMLMQNSKLARKLEANSINKLIYVISKDDCLIDSKLDEELSNVDRSKLVRVELERGRKIGQIYLTSLWTFLVSLIHSLVIILNHKPNLCITNGPAISVSILLAIRCLQMATFKLSYSCKVVYIESFCRTKTLSLSGKIIYHLRLADEFYVQWPGLSNSYSRAKYKGLLV